MEEDERLLRNGIGARLKAERDRLGLTTDEWGAKAGVHRSSAFNYESGARVPDALVLHRMHRDVGFDVQYVVTGKRATDGAPMPDGDRALLDRVHGMPPDIRRTVDDVVLLSYLAASARVDYHRGGCAVEPPATYRGYTSEGPVVAHDSVGQVKPKRTPR